LSREEATPSVLDELLKLERLVADLRTKTGTEANELRGRIKELERRLVELESSPPTGRGKKQPKAERGPKQPKAQKAPRAERVQSPAKSERAAAKERLRASRGESDPGAHEGDEPS
jgi:uncharacterized membrane protein